MKFELKGYNIDNLIKTLVSKKVILYNINRTRYNEISFEIDDKNYKKVKRHITNFKITQSFTKLKKIPSFLLANLGLVLGIFFGLIFFIFVSPYTWQIQVYGTENLTKQDIVSVLEANNIKVGKINLQTSEEIEEILLNNYDRIAQVSVIKEGTAIIINLSEKLVYFEEEFEPIIAKSNGIITEINIITGTTNVKVGDYVNKGDILVLPFNINSNGEKVSVRPIAEIKAEIYIVSKCEMSKTEKILVRSGKIQKSYNYKLFNFNLFSGKSKNSFALFEMVVYNENISRLIPFSREVCVYYELIEQTITHDFDNEKQNLQEKSIAEARKNLIAGDILDETTQISIVEDKMYACTTIKLEGKINDWICR